jgi:hypothetical protein
MLQFTQQFTTSTAATTNSSDVAKKWVTFCSGIKAYNASMCDSVRACIASSFAGSMGKQAGKLCQLFGSCTVAVVSEGCPIITQLLNGQLVRQNLDMCTVEGVTGGSRVPGVSGSAALAPGRCFNSGDCKSDSLECSMTNPVTIYTCEQGTLVSSTQGTCVKTACQVCRDCLSATQPFALKQASASNATKIAEEWLVYCNVNSDSLGAATKCAEVAANISTTGVVLGNLGKRAAGLCFALGRCSSGICSNGTDLDRCMVQGLKSGMRVPGVAASTDLPYGQCFHKDNCTAPADTCTPGTTKLCTCANGVDTCSTAPLGTCTIASGGCSDCKQCLLTVQPFIQGLLAGNTSTSQWASFCKTHKASTSSAACDNAVQTMFSSSATGAVNSYHRAGMLCSALQRCSSTCTIGNITLLSGASAASAAGLDFCTAEGVTGGRVLSTFGVSATKDLPKGSCQNDMQCGDTNLQCNTSSATRFCYCQGGTDFCSDIGTCKPTPCAVCNDCLDAANNLVDTTKFMQGSAAVASAYTTWCKAQPNLADKCSNVNIMSASINTGKRASLLCQALGACNAAALPATCKLASRKAGAAVAAKGGVLVSIVNDCLASKWHLDLCGRPALSRHSHVLACSQPAQPSSAGHVKAFGLLLKTVCAHWHPPHSPIICS